MGLRALIFALIPYTLGFNHVDLPTAMNYQTTKPASIDVPKSSTEADVRVETSLRSTKRSEHLSTESEKTCRSRCDKVALGGEGDESRRELIFSTLGAIIASSSTLVQPSHAAIPNYEVSKRRCIVVNKCSKPLTSLVCFSPTPKRTTTDSRKFALPPLPPPLPSPSPLTTPSPPPPRPTQPS